MATYTDAAWSSPESELDADEYCACCLMDWNSAGQKKIKDKCALPIRKRRGGPIFKQALRTASGGHGVMRVKGAPASEKRKAARALIRHMRAADIAVTAASLFRIAGMRQPKEK